MDVLVGNEEDLQMGLGMPGPKVAAKSKLDPSAFFAMIEPVITKYPNVKIIATTLREVLRAISMAGVRWHGSTAKHNLRPAWSWMCTIEWAAATASLPDSFTDCLREEPEEAVKLGWAHGALLTTYPGDTTMATVEQVRSFAKGGSARIQR